MMSARPGMTLIEVAVAISLASVVSLIGFAAFNAVVTESARFAEQSADVHAATTRRTLIEWLESAIVVSGVEATSFRGMDQQNDGLEHDYLEFTTAALTPIAEGNTIVRLYIDMDTATAEEGLVAALYEWGTSRTQNIQLDSTVTELDAQYASRLVSHAAWLPSWVSTTVLPDRVELRLRGENLHPLLQLPMLIGVGAPR